MAKCFLHVDRISSHVWLQKVYSFQALVSTRVFLFLIGTPGQDTWYKSNILRVDDKSYNTNYILIGKCVIMTCLEGYILQQ